MASESAGNNEVETQKKAEAKLHRGIPKADFLEDIDTYMKDTDESVEAVLRRFDMQAQKYRYMEASLEQKKERSKDRPVNIRKTLDVVKHLQATKDSGESMHVQAMLADQLYVNTLIPPTSAVCLWLGANVMLEYPIEEAQQLLENNLVTATKNLEEIQSDLEFLRDQRVTTEVNMARVFNWNVRRKDAKKPN
jgi:prefoldin subunit 5